MLVCTCRACITSLGICFILQVGGAEREQHACSSVVGASCVREEIHVHGVQCEQQRVSPHVVGCACHFWNQLPNLEGYVTHRP